MTDAATLRKRIAHDVGKYVARTARNLPEGKAPAVLVGMLLTDLYGSAREPRASARLDALAGASADASIVAARERLAAVDALEADVRAGDERAIRRAAALALEVEAILRGAPGGGDAR